MKSAVGGGSDGCSDDAPAAAKTPTAAAPFASSVDTLVAAVQSLAAAAADGDGLGEEDAFDDQQMDGADDWDYSEDNLGTGDDGVEDDVAVRRRRAKAKTPVGDNKPKERIKGGRGEEEALLLEACCLVMLTERFPPGFIDEEAVAGLLLAADALDAVCMRGLRSVLRQRVDAAATTNRSTGKNDGNPKKRRGDGGVGGDVAVVVGREGLVEAVTALRAFMLRLGRELPASSSLLERLSPGDSLLRVIRRPVGVSASGKSLSLSPLLRSLAALLPFLAERCVVTGQTTAVLEAVARLDLTAAAGVGGGRRRRQQLQHRHNPHQHQLGSGKDNRLVLLHGILSGVVTGETRRLAAAAAAASSLSSEDFSDDDMSDEEDGLPTAVIVAPSLAQLSPSAPDEPGALFAAVAYFVGCLPVPPLPATAAAAAAMATAAVSTDLLQPLSPSILPVWGDALRLSFLGPHAQQLVFARGGGGGGGGAGAGVRSRSQWVEDAVMYLRERAEEAVLASVGRPSSAGCREKDGSVVLPTRLVVVGGGGGGDEVATGSSERSGCCHLLRAVCGCSHLLDPPLPRPVVRVLVEAFLGMIVAGERVGGSRGGRNRDENAAQQQWRGEANLLLQTAFCLLVQHASPGQLDEIVATLLETLTLLGTSPVGRTVGRTVVGSTVGGSTVGSSRSAASSRCEACSAAAAVTLVRLTTQASRGAAFNAVMPNRALSLAAALCGKLRGGDQRCCCMRGGGIGGGGGGFACGYRLESRIGALTALDGLLNRQPYASVTARVVSVVLGSLEPAARAALHAAESSAYRGHGHGYGSGSIASGRSRDSSPYDDCRRRHAVEDSLRCFLACCRVLGTILHHYAPKVFSCAPPFAALCRSLLRLFFRLAAPSVAGENNSRDSNNNNVNMLSLEEQASAASVLSRVLEQFVPHKKVLKKYAAFLLLEYVSLAGSVALEPAPRAALLAGVFAVMEACTRREMRQLHGLLAALPTGQEVFRSLNEEYQRQHKYTGKM